MLLTLKFPFPSQSATTRNRACLAFVSDNAARKITYKKRKKGLAKKLSELITLCGIQACAVLFSCYESKPEVWPDSSAAQQVIARFQNTYARDETRNLNQESLTSQRIAKVSAQLKKQRKENSKKEMNLAMFQCADEGGSVDDEAMVDPDELDSLAQENINIIDNKMHEFI